MTRHPDRLVIAERAEARRIIGDMPQGNEPEWGTVSASSMEQVAGYITQYWKNWQDLEDRITLALLRAKRSGVHSSQGDFLDYERFSQLRGDDGREKGQAGCQDASQGKVEDARDGDGQEGGLGMEGALTREHMATGTMDLPDGVFNLPYIEWGALLQSGEMVKADSTATLES